ncbi:MAG: hypothetical protein GC200_06815 [Tepidisphaera sp.]|nr:hypothetical protein [Tepidisphaera sp.]
MQQQLRAVIVGGVLVALAGAGPGVALGQGGVTIIRGGPSVTVISGPAEPAQAAPDEGEAPAPPPEMDSPPDGAEGAAPAPAGGPPAAVSKEETADLKAQFEALPKEGQDEMRAYYKDLGVDLDQVLGLANAANEAMQRFQEASNTMRELDFTRSPNNVLSARAKLGFGQVPRPNVSSAQGGDITRWIHLLTMAGEWRQLGEFFQQLPPKDASSLYGTVVQMLNRGVGAGLLPEEVLALSEACPDEEPKEWVIKAWTAMTKVACVKNSPTTMLERIKSGTRFFGPGTAEKRRRTVELLTGAGLMQEAYDYLPPLDEARAAGDGELLLAHGQYQADLADRAGDDPAAEGERARAWDLYTEVSQMGRASTDSRREAVRLALGMMGRMPRSKVDPWLNVVFADDTLAPAALEGIATSAAAISEGNGVAEDDRAQAIVTLKQAVDILLDHQEINRSVLQVPLRMLTTALVTQMETSVTQKGRQRTVSKDLQLLLRAIPGGKWMDALEPSLAARAEKACIQLATTCDETDMALQLVASAVKRTPEEARELANAFLTTWQQRLSPGNDYDDDSMMYYWWRDYVAQAPLTRGRQRRNLDRLSQLMQTMRDAGLEPRTLPAIAPVFKACHGVTEVYERGEIEHVFGPIDKIPATTCMALASTMAGSLNGDWRNRAVQVENGVKRTDAEIATLVDRGYELAIDLSRSALTQQPDSWRCAVLQAALTYDRLQFRALQKKKTGDTTKDAEVKLAAFAAFKDAAQRYVKAVSAGEEREDPTIFLRWFGAAMGTSQLNFIASDEMPVEGSKESDQVDAIRDEIDALPAESRSRHIGEFARAIGLAVSRSDPEVKPKLVKQALRIVRDDPAGASLRSLDELYRDLVKDEIKLRLSIDGPDDVGAARPFCVLLSLRYTNSVDRETGGFSKYLQTNAFTRVGRQYQEINYREKLEKNIRESLSKGFSVESIGFFEPYMPARGVSEGGQEGWLEKPLAYLVLTRKDPAADRLPQISMDMQFEDSTGPVTLVLPSNSPGLAVGPASAALRPCPDLKITQVVDPRDARDQQKAKTVTLEVVARGKGAIPELNDLLAGVDDALPGYTIDHDKGIEVRPISVVQEGTSSNSRYFWGGPPKAPDGGYPEADDHGIYRLPIERSWLVTYTPGEGSLAGAFTLPTLKSGLKAELDSKYYSDLDIVPVKGASVPVERRTWTMPLVVTGALLALVAGAMLWWRRRASRPSEARDELALPARVTPLSTVMALRRLQVEHGPSLDETRRGALAQDIALIEMKYFGPQNGTTNADADLSETLRRWARTVRG